MRRERSIDAKTPFRFPPVLDDDKHYWVGEAEIEKLLRHGREWLPAHPARELIANRYLARQRTLTREALARLSESGDVDEADGRWLTSASGKARLERLRERK